MRDEEGVPIGNAQVTIFTTYKKVVSQLDLLTGSYGRLVGQFNGGFRCGDSLEIECTAPGFVAMPRSTVAIAPHATEVKFDFTLKRRPGNLIRGRIVDPTGLPLKLESVLATTFTTIAPFARSAKVSLRAIPSGATNEDGATEGRIDYAKGMYDIVLADGFLGSLKLRIAKTVVGEVPLLDLSRPPDLPCDAARIPKAAASTTVEVRFVDSESKQPINLERMPYPPQTIDGTWIQPGATSDNGLRNGVVKYGCKPGKLMIKVVIEGYAASLLSVDVPERAPPVPLTLEVPRAQAGVRGVAFRSDGRPIAKAPITIYRVTPTGLIDATGMNVATNPDGEFLFSGLAKGDHIIVVSGLPDEAPAVARFVATDPFSDLEVHTATGHPIQFHVSTKTSLADSSDTTYYVADKNGVIVEDTHRNWGGTSRALDDFSAMLADGHYSVHVERDGYRDASVEFNIPAEGTIDVPLEPRDPVSK